MNITHWLDIIEAIVILAALVSVILYFVGRFGGVQWPK